ncbi:hypothetical protein E1264_03385 [Actinomadura sp. KC216]|uniref:hypothetical protein n=1 Tax=Actinomadura sp. KC216 TaxID=2530370 RepID=UPI001044A7DB|nr:hypothetical protein [Actinomadura sp. KC216]TDB90882.1 hypothetical protein E1264_03385 [Actinomadura sp. KC216]
MTKPTFAALESKVRELASANPDFVYDRGDYISCRYNPDDLQPGCLFGQAFIALGHPIPMHLDTRPIDTVLRILAIEMTPEEESWAWYAQKGQDRGKPWGEAVKNADRLHPLS